MTIGTYKIKYPAILKKEYEDGSIEYETDFNDDTDVISWRESVWEKIM